VLPGLLFGLTVLVEVASVALSWGLEPAYDTVMYAAFSVVSVGAGALVARRHPRNAIGWLLCGFGLFNALAADAVQGCGRPRRDGRGPSPRSGSPRPAGCPAGSAGS
jgi:hypothetical protein